MLSFKAGKLAAHFSQWQSLTSDPEILETGSGCKIEFDTIPSLNKVMVHAVLSETQTESVDTEVSNLLRKQAIEACDHEAGEYISPIFTRPKKDGSHRMILNLKSLNKHITHHHFKMDTVLTAVRLMKPGCFMASIDLKDAYYSVSIHSDFQKYLKFSWRGQLYKFVCFPNGLAPCPRQFTKLLKPVFSSLRKLGHISVVYIDDTWLTSEDYNSCVNNIAETITLLDRLGFVIHPEKSILIPTQEITFLGFIFNSANMTLKLTPERALKLKTACLENLEAATPHIRDVARLLGLMTSSYPGVMYGALHYRALEMGKTCALKQNKGNFDRPMTLSSEAKSDIQWWIDSISEAYNPVNHGDPDVIMTTDASLLGWGACLDGMTTGGRWNPDEATHDINYLEMLAALFALQSFSDKVSAKHIKLMVDNTTAVATINQLGTWHSNLNNKLVQQIWEWCILHGVWLTVAHIPGKSNTEADRESRLTRKETEWCLDRSIYSAVIQKLDVTPDIDLFASRLNHQLKPYIAYRPDPGALAVNAFHISWKEYIFYAFPPFCIIQRVLQKINIDQATGIIIVPNWPTQTWWPYLMSMLINYPIILPRKTRTLFLPAQPQEIHPLHTKLELLACHLSGTSCLTKEFQKKLQNLSSNPGGQGHRSNIELTLKDGKCSVLQGKLIPFVVL